jgi:polyphosphate kinase
MGGEDTLAGRPDRFLNRELSWLEFNSRVLALVERRDLPVLERAKFLAIFSTNLDEFYQVRVAGLSDQVAAGIAGLTPDGLTAKEQLIAIHQKVEELTARSAAVFHDQVVPDLAENSIHFSRWIELDETDRAYLIDVFETQIHPVLTPLAVDPSHPFPYISNLSLNLAVVVRDRNGNRHVARVKVPSLLPRFVVMPDGERFLPLEQVIAAHLDRLFPGMEVAEHYVFRLIRNSDISLEEDEADDLLEAVEVEVRRRRFGKAVRLEVERGMAPPIRQLLERELDVSETEVVELMGPIDLGGLWAVYGLDRPKLKDPSWNPITPGRDRQLDDPGELFELIRDGDLLVHHPYDSFATTVEELIRQASMDPDVLALKMTLYRTSGDSPIVKSLIRAADAGKQVAVLVELKARFDEEANIEWARRLEEAGVHVVYGITGLKTHTKTALIVRREGERINRYCHVGTGNYNPRTARIYEDLGLLSCAEDLGADLTHLFNSLTGYGTDIWYERLLVAPTGVRTTLRSLIEQEAAYGAEGLIVCKMNSLVDPELIDAFYAASQAGVNIVLIVRGICCLRPGVPGLSDNIRVRSIVGRYLEHSRVYHFAHGWGPDEPAWYIGSADLMPRNLDRRVEALVSILDHEAQRRLSEVLEVNLSDNVLAWELDADDKWRKLETDGAEPVNTHLRLQDLALERAQR